MKLTTGILAIAVVVGGTAATQAVAQNTDAIDQARSIAKSLQQKQEIDSNKALDAAGTPDPKKPALSKPAPGSPAPAIKAAVIPGSAAEAKPATSSAEHNQLKRVTVVPDGDSIQIEMSSSQSVKPRVSKLSSPARVVVELPETVVASSQNKDCGWQRRSERYSHRHGRQDASDDQRCRGSRQSSGLRDRAEC